MSERTKGMLRICEPQEGAGVVGILPSLKSFVVAAPNPNTDKLTRYGVAHANMAHVAACWNAIEAHGGEADVVGELVKACQLALGAMEYIAVPTRPDQDALDALRAVLAKAKENAT